MAEDSEVLVMNLCLMEMTEVVGIRTQNCLKNHHDFLEPVCVQHGEHQTHDVGSFQAQRTTSGKHSKHWHPVLVLYDWQ